MLYPKICARYLAKPTATDIYFGFNARDMMKVRSLVKNGSLPSLGLNWTTDGCSSVGSVLNMATFGRFQAGCERHDFGYSNPVAIFGRVSEADRKTVDGNLLHDDLYSCPFFTFHACEATAQDMYVGVRIGGQPYYKEGQ